MSTPKTQRPGTAGAAEISRALRLLGRRNAKAEPIGSGSDPDAGIMIVEQGGASRRRVPPGVWSCLVERGWVEPDGTETDWRISPRGRAEVALRASERIKPADDPARHHGIVPPSAAKPGYDFAECPVAWLARRKDKNGEPLITSEQLAAAERLRADFWFSGMTPRVTTNWTAALGGGRAQRSPAGAGVDIQDAVIAAGIRVNRALAAVGPDLSGLLVDVCCHLKGLETVERSFRWPQRSAKVILAIALTQLARHYGIDQSLSMRGRSGRPDIRHWGAVGFRPAVEHAQSLDHSAGAGSGE